VGHGKQVFVVCIQSVEQVHQAEILKFWVSVSKHMTRIDFCRLVGAGFQLSSFSSLTPPDFHPSTKAGEAKN